MDKTVVALVLNYNDSDTTIHYIKNIKSYKSIHKILIVDNCSTDDSYNQLLSCVDEKTHLIKTDYNGGYGYGNNYGLRYISEFFFDSYVLITNPDVSYDEQVVIQLLNSFDEKTAVASLMMKNAEGKEELGCVWKVPSKYQYIFSSLMLLPKLFHFNSYKKEELIENDKIYVDCVAGSMLMVDLKLMIEYGMYDENIFLYGEETVLGYKLKKQGFKTAFLTNCSFLHLHGVSTKKSIKSVSKRRRILLNSRYYILNKYLGANGFDLFIAKVVYSISVFEVWIKNAILGILNR